jgi:alpha-beta hydrolase superfamily lysophospholipase
MRKKILYSLLILFLLFFSLLNYIAYKHSYNFTHYANIQENKLKVSDTSQISLQKKLGYILKGVEVPRPENKTKPFYDFETTYIATPKGKLEVWQSKVDDSKGIVIMFHGYANRKSSLVSRSYEFVLLGYNVMLVDFLGSGGSDGNTVSIGYYEADQVKACIDYLNEKGEKNVYLFGISMGAVASMKCVNDHQPNIKGLIVECPFGYFKSTVKNRFKNFGVPSFPMADLLMLWGNYHMGYNTYSHNPVDYAAHINCPTLLMHGEKDHAVSKKEIDDIYANLKGEKFLKTFPNTGHDIFLPKNEITWMNTVIDFMISTKTMDETDRKDLY